jgi:gluconolactonase
MFPNAALLIVAFCTPAIAAAAGATPEAIAGIGPLGEVEKIHTGLQFTEGPAGDAQGNVYFTDIPANKIYRSDANGQLTTFSDQSNHANGLMFNSRGELVACEMDGRIAAWNIATKERRVLAQTYQGKRFNAPNDLVIDQQGGIYFTDPHFRAPEPLPQGKTAVYYVDGEGNVTRLVDNLPAPNGVILSPDEKTLYVFPSLQAEMMAYPVETPGVLGEGRQFCRLQQPGGSRNSGADGVTVDTQGNLYITSDLGIQVFASNGQLLGVIAIPERPSNVTFAGLDGQTLYITARTSLYRAKMQAKGHRFADASKPGSDQ